MKEKKFAGMDGNEAVAYVAFRTNEVVAIYPITPSSNMAEWCDDWAAAGQRNIWGAIPNVAEMQSEAGAAGAVHGALQAGSLSTTFTAAQGLLLMIPNMYKIAGELTPSVFHVSARTVATHALSIFGDHSDVMSTRATGFGLIASASPQEAHDMALISQAATLESRIPFVHFFDGFRTSHEVQKIEVLPDEVIREMIDDDLVLAHRNRSLNPDRPVLRGTAQNPDVFFQAQETRTPFYAACPDIVQKAMDKFGKLTGRQYKLFQYYGAEDAERVIVLMASGCETAQETIDHLVASGEKVGVVKVRLFMPFDAKKMVEALPATVKSIAVLDRCREYGAAGEPLYQEILTGLHESLGKAGRLKAMPKVIAGRYGLSSKEFTPGMVKGVFDHLKQAEPKHHFTVGINDDVGGTSIPYDNSLVTEPAGTVTALFYGLGSDGTVGANKNSIKIIGDETENYAQGYFVYDSKKAGTITVSHLRFGPKPIHSPYLITAADFVACHNPVFLERYDMLKTLKTGAVFLLNTPHAADKVWDELPRRAQKQIVDKKAKFYVIDATSVARACGMGGRVNTCLQTCFFAISGVLPREQAIEAIKKSIKKAYGKKGEDVVAKNIKVVEQSLEHLHEVKYPAEVSSKWDVQPAVPAEAPEYVRKVLGKIIEGDGDDLPVSAFAPDGTFPTATTKWEKRNLALELPEWDPNVCNRDGWCALVCPHAAIRIKVYDPKYAEGAPATFKSMVPKEKEWAGMRYTIQVAPEDCTGCALCVEFCPAKDKTNPSRKAINMVPQAPIRATERDNWNYFLNIPEFDRTKIRVDQLRHQQLQRPLFEFSGACSGCGETPYVKLMTQLFGDRTVVTNATGCSSIYGGNLPTTPYCVDENGRGPAWNNSLFEDNAEFGMGIRLAQDMQVDTACVLLKKLAPQIGTELVDALINAKQTDEAGIAEQRARVVTLRQKLQGMTSPEAKQLANLADMMVRKSVWIVGGDGWAYDIGYGGLDHVIASGQNVNLLVLDTEVYSNTGGQASKSTPRGAVAKFAAGGKPAQKKDLALMAMSYGNVYVARVAMGYNPSQTLKAFLEADAYNGPSLIIAYSHCIAHGMDDMEHGMEHQKAAVESGAQILCRFNPDLAAQGKNPLMLDSRAPKRSLEEFMYSETRFKMLTKSKPEQAKALLEQSQKEVNERFAYYQYLAQRPFGVAPAPATDKPSA